MMILQQKPIKSYVRREGRMTPSQRHALSTLWLKYGLEMQTDINFEQIFGRKAEKILEIGFGMGQSLVAMSKAMPDKDFIGIEVHRPGVGALLAALEQHQLNNVRIFCADAVEVLKCCIPENYLDQIQIFFPDPWPKQRHHKRRLIQPEFITLVCDKLKVNSVLHLATDWQDYAEQMLQVLSNVTSCYNAAGVENYVSRPDYRPLTKFEIRGQKLGHKVWDLVFIKKE